MEKEFPLEIITPQQAFWQRPAQALTLTGPFGSMTVLADHAPLVAGIAAQSFRVKADGQWQTLYCGDGFLQVCPGEVLLFVQDCAWPQELDEHRQREAHAAEEELALRRRGLHEAHSAEVTMRRKLMDAGQKERQQQD